VAEWLETYRGVANPWECDVVEHLTIAYYFDRFADAAGNFFDLVGAHDAPGEATSDAAGGDQRHGPAGPLAGMGRAAVRGLASFRHELRAGDAFHILTAVTGAAEAAVALGHQVVDSASGRTVTWLSETYTASGLAAATRSRLAAHIVPWPGPPMPDAVAPWTRKGLPTARDRVKPWELGEDGSMSLPAHVHRFSAAGMQILAAVGMTGAYMQEKRRGFSTFELDLTRTGTAGLGEIVDVTTLFARLGNSSLRLAHRMTGPGGREIARLVQSGVHLDTDARRSAPIPAELRQAIEKLLLASP
jgi:acyl-CoA thioesterase FadM